MTNTFERFHYTDIDGLLGILKSNTLWLCSYKSMNDSMELKWSLNEKLDAIKKTIEKDYDEVKYEFLEKIRSCLKEIPLHAYMACFSSQKDLLSQWRAYGDDGKGVSIGFKLGQESNFPDKDLPICSVGQSYFGCFDVEYGTDFEEKIIPFDGYIHAFNEHVKNLSRDPSKMDDNAKEMSEIMISLSMWAKNPAFQEEKECRILNLTLQNSDIDLSQLEFKATGKKLTPYLEYKFNKSIVYEIVLGPKSEIDKDELDLFLQKHGYEDVNIEPSGISYR
ncbi:DUF2971 domain-containing protein [Vibrio lentus]|uniref:DUF2971 domain-containing protein n=1 Tax=Vibrio TaxID=662 RepID=UPI0010543DF2|nr:DUF2971 domain-containing protein [Vibrio lentus]